MTRLHVGAAMPLKGGRPAVAVAEVREGRGSDGRLRFQFHVGHLERVTPYGVHDAAASVRTVLERLRDMYPCVIVDVGSPQGLALHQQLKREGDPQLHRPHAWPGTGSRGPLFSSFLQAYSEGRLTLDPRMAHRADLERALVFFGGSSVKEHGLEISSEEEAMVHAVGLALQWPVHGPAARPLVEATEVSEG